MTRKYTPASYYQENGDRYLAPLTETPPDLSDIARFIEQAISASDRDKLERLREQLEGQDGDAVDELRDRIAEALGEKSRGKRSVANHLQNVNAPLGRRMERKGKKGLGWVDRFTAAIDQSVEMVEALLDDLNTGVDINTVAFMDIQEEAGVMEAAIADAIARLDAARKKLGVKKSDGAHLLYR